MVVGDNLIPVQGPARRPRPDRRSAPNLRMNSINCGNFGGPARRALQKVSCAFKRGPPERWPSGLRRTLGKRVCGKPYRGFESHSLRHPTAAAEKFFKIKRFKNCRWRIV